MENNNEMGKNSQQELKHLGFVRAVAINTFVWLSNLYDYAKQNSGPLRSAAGSVESAVTTVISPVYDKFKDLPDHLLVFLDEKVDEHAPPLAKKVASHVYQVIEKTTQIAKGVIHEAQVDGPSAAARLAAKESTQLVLNQSILVWSKLDQLPPFHMVAELTVPTAAHWSEKYNKLVTNMRSKGYGVFNYTPLIPTDDIAKAFKRYKDGNESEIANSPAGEVSSQ